MKNPVLLLFIGLSSILFSQTFEPFNFTGSANTNGWTTHSGTAGQMQALTTPSNSGNSLYYTNLAASAGNRIGYVSGSTEDVNKPISGITGSGYFSFLLNVINTTGLNTTGDYFIGFGGAAGTPVTILGARTYIKAGATANTFMMGVLNTSTGTATFLPTEYPCGTTILVVLKLVNTSNPIAASIWVNPVPGNAEPAPDATNNIGTNLFANFASIFLRQGAGTGNLEVDEIRVGSTWADVTPCASPTTYYQDLDGDSYGNLNVPILSCLVLPGLVSNSLDCDDTNAAINPTTVWYADADGDTYGNALVSQVGCLQPTGYVLNNTDCNDNNASANAVATWYQDMDGDGFGNLNVSQVNCGQPLGYVASNTDCNDNAALINPNAVEIFDAIDNNCNGSVDEGFTPVPYYLDQDGDGVGGSTFVMNVVSPGPNYSLTTGDCNDLNANMYPGNTEICDNLDNDCDATIDEGLILITYYQDSDGDNYGNVNITIAACSTPNGYVLDTTDCNDANANIHPGAVDIPGNGIDEDCSGLDAPLVMSQFGIYEFTGLAACPVLADTVTSQPAFATFSTFTNAGGACTAAANVFNNNNWNTGTTVNLQNYNEFSVVADSCYDMDLTKLKFTYKVSNVNTFPIWHVRSSLDNYAADIAFDTIPTNAYITDSVILGSSFLSVSQVTFRFYITEISTTGATWRQDNVSLWGFMNAITPQNFYADVDGDGFGDASSVLSACSAPQGYVGDNTDCNDTNNQINPNTIWFVDGDMDGYGDPNNFTTSCLTPPGTVLNGLDCDDTNNLVALVTMYYVDADGDGFGDDATGVESCYQAPMTVTVGGDCDDLNDQIYPGATEVCDGLDNDCVNGVDDGLATTTYYEDLDNDSYGSDITLITCEVLGSGYVLVNGDCDDTNDAIYPGATEILDNTIDENCDGVDNYLGVNDISFENILVAPNPTIDAFSVTVIGNEFFDLKSYNLRGELIQINSEMTSGSVVTTSSWARGTYLIHVTTSTSTKVIRLVKN